MGTRWRLLDRCQIDPQHLVYESGKPGPGGSVSLLLTPLELLDRLAALIPPPPTSPSSLRGAGAASVNCVAAAGAGTALSAPDRGVVVAPDGSTVYRAFTPCHLEHATDPLPVGTSTLIVAFSPGSTPAFSAPPWREQSSFDDHVVSRIPAAPTRADTQTP